MRCSRPSASVRPARQGRGRQGCRSSSRMMSRTSSGPQGTPRAGAGRGSAGTRRSRQSRECLLDQVRESVASAGGHRYRAFSPVEETGWRYLQPLAHFLHWVGALRVAVAARVDELVPVGYRGFRARSTLRPFFRNSFSMRSSRSSGSTSRSRARSLALSGGSSPACSVRCIG